MASNRVIEVLALADALWFLPRPARRPIADKLHGLGVRIHPELATLFVEDTGPANLAAAMPQHVVAMDKTRGLAVLRDMATQAGDRNLADLADRIEAATTDDQITAERDRLAPHIPDVLKTIEDNLADGDTQ